MEYIVEKEYNGILLRTYLKNCLLLSRSLVSHLKRNEGIFVNGENVTVRYILKTGDKVDIRFEDKSTEENEKIIPVDIPLNIVYEDEDFVVVDKPPFMPVHTSHGHYCDTLANALAFRYRKTGFVMRAVNRLDRNTSGLVLVARNRRSAGILSNQMKNRTIGKEYMALVEGKPPEKFTIEAYIRRRDASVIERCVCNKEDEGAEYALSQGEVLKTLCIGSDKTVSLVRLIPHTGRTHQLRVHMSHFGFPIVGDDLYGNGGQRQLLHCNMLEFSHPTTSKRLKFESFVDLSEAYSV